MLRSSHSCKVAKRSPGGKLRRRPPLDMGYKVAIAGGAGVVNHQVTDAISGLATVMLGYLVQRPAKPQT